MSSRPRMEESNPIRLPDTRRVQRAGMSASEIKTHYRCPAVATVIFRPDLSLLNDMVSTVTRDCSVVYVHMNGPHSEAVESCFEAVGAAVSRSAENVGLGAGLNRVMAAAAEAGHRHVLLLDQDSSPPEGLATDLAARLQHLESLDHKIAAIGPRLSAPERSGYLAIKPHRRARAAGDPPGAVEFLPTSGTLISVEAWLRVGPFRGDYFIGGIDVEWGQRAWAHGFASVLVDDVTMVHRWGEINVDRGRPQILRQPAMRIHYYVRNATHGMTLSHMSFRWKRWQAVRLIGQVFLLVRYRSDFSIGRLARAVRDGWSGRLGPLPSED